MQDFLLFLCVGFLAQIVDGALGMAYGLVSSTVLLTFGVTPAIRSKAPVGYLRRPSPERWKALP